MNKKKLVLLTLALVLIATIGVGATLAYFTDSTEATNIITMGHVDIEINEPHFDGEDGEDDDTVKDIVPGQVITKDPTITVANDSQDAYIRATITLSENLTDEQKTELLAGIDILDGWFLAEDKYYYYNKEVTAGESIVLFEEVKIPERWGNEVVDTEFSIDVAAEAIQVEGFTPDKNDDGFVTGWYYKSTDADGNEVKEAITAEIYEAKTATETEQ